MAQHFIDILWPYVRVAVVSILSVAVLKTSFKLFKRFSK